MQRHPLNEYPDDPTALIQQVERDTGDTLTDSARRAAIGAVEELTQD